MLFIFFIFVFNLNLSISKFFRSGFEQSAISCGEVREKCSSDDGDCFFFIFFLFFFFSVVLAVDDDIQKHSTYRKNKLKVPNYQPE